MGQFDEEVRDVQPLLDADEIGIVEESLRLLGDRTDRMVNYFYAALFVEAPHLRSLFPAAMDTQRDRLFKALTEAVRNLAAPEIFVPMLLQMGADHRKYGVREEHYDAVGRALIVSLRHHAEDVWVPELEAAWTKAYDTMAQTMIDGAREAAGRQPAWWRARSSPTSAARTTSRCSSSARTGPTTTSQGSTPASRRRTAPGRGAPTRWRRPPRRTGCWSSTSARSGPAGSAGRWCGGPRWVTSSRIGAPMGDMRIDQQSRRDILCIAGGTGLAPIKAIVDGMSRWNTSRRVTVVFGARRPHELYDLGALHRMAAMNPWLTVVPAVSEDPTFNGERGLLPDVVARLGHWTDHDVFLCGSPAMTQATVARLTALGVPADRLRYDVVGDSHPATSEMAKVIDLRRRAGRTQR